MSRFHPTDPHRWADGTLRPGKAAALVTRALWHVWWAGYDVPDAEVSVEISREFFRQTLSDADVKAELLRWQSGGCSWETFDFNMTKGGRNRPGVTAEEERTLIEAEDQSPMQKAIEAGLPTVGNTGNPSNTAKKRAGPTKEAV